MLKERIIMCDSVHEAWSIARTDVTRWNLAKDCAARNINRKQWAAGDVANFHAQNRWHYLHLDSSGPWWGWCVIVTVISHDAGIIKMYLFIFDALFQWRIASCNFYDKNILQYSCTLMLMRFRDHCQTFSIMFHRFSGVDIYFKSID